MNGINNVKLFDIPKILDERGNLSFIERGNLLTFDMQRAYWIYDVPGGEIRGGHAFREQEEVIIALSGSFDVVLHDGLKENTVSLNRSYKGLYVPKMLWRRMENFSTNAVCLVLASTVYREDDYIRDFNTFKNLRKIDGFNSL
jgi:dTDP-4-dehydrorhamnose 3,5-epimerase-like enzyme